MHAAKHFDPQVGLDFHWTMLGLIGPFPIPTPHIGIVLDPFDYIPIIGGTVHVNGVKRATAGTGGLDVHIPLGAWLPPMKVPGGPQWDDEIFMGSMTVLADGDPLSRIAMPVLDCNFVGLVNPFRPRKPEAPQLSLSLPTAVNLAIPNHVNVGGPPMISLMSMAFKGLFAGLGKLRKLKSVQRVMEGAKNKWSKLFSNMEPGFFKCKILRAEPVDIRSGAVSVTHEDFSIPGRLPLAWVRRYRSDAIDQAGVCGWGWTTPADIRLEVGEDGVVFLPLQGPPAVFERLPLPGEGLVDPIDGARLTRVKAPQGEELHLRTKDDVVHVFAAPPAHVVPLPGLPPRHLRIERLEDRCGNAWTFEREGEHLTRIAERGLDTSPGRFITVGAQGGRIHTMALHDPISGTTFPLVRYRHDAQGDLVAALDALDAARSFDYREHRLVRHTDRVGLSFHYTYDDQARVVHSWGDGGLYDYTFAYHDELHETEVTDSLGHTSLVKFDADGLPLCEIDPLGGCTFFEYDEWGRTTAISDPCGLRTEFAYDARSNLESLTRADGSKIRMAFDDDDKVVEVTDPMGGQWHQHWDDRGRLVAQVSPLGAQSTFDYHPDGLLARHTNARGATAEFAFDPHGQLHLIINAMGLRTHFEHDALGRNLSRTDPAGRRTQFRIDLKGRLVETRLPGGHGWTCSYDAEDRLVRFVDERGAATELAYAGLGRIAERRQSDNHRVQFQYDTEERLVALVNQRGEASTIQRDALGRVTRETDYWGQSRAYAYDPSGRLCSSVDALGRTIQFATDALGRITKKTCLDTSAAGSTPTEQLRYSKAGQLIEMSNSVSRVKRAFDADGRLVEEIQNDFRIQYQLDEVGNRTQRRTSAGNCVKVEFDPMDQPKAIVLNDAAPISIERDALGRVMLERLGAHIQRAMGYNDDGLVTRQSARCDSQLSFETSFAYDAAGNLLRRSDSMQGSETFTYDPVGRLLSHIDAAQQVRHFANDPAGDRLSTRIRESEQLQVVGGDAQPGTWVREGWHEGVLYTFDRSGNLVSKRYGDGRGAATIQLSWDANLRLARSEWRGGDRDGQVTTYGYDPLGRRVHKRTPTHTIHYFWDGDALLAEAQQDHEVSAPGASTVVASLAEARLRKQSTQRLHESAREYVYRPRSFEPLALIDKALTSPVNVAAGRADPPGYAPQASDTPEVRSSKSGGFGLGWGGASLDGSMVLGGSAAINMASQNSSLLGPSAPETDPPPATADPIGSDVTQDGIYYYFNDPNGCPTRLLRAQGQIVWSSTYSAWGRAEHLGQEGIDQPLRLQGQQADSETGLHYNRHRYYDPQVGQFASQDPIGLHGGLNPYQLGANTRRWIDPTGLKGCLLEEADELTHDYVLKISKSEYPESVQHIEDAIANGKADIVEIARGGAKQNRADSLRGIPTKTGYDRDEWPMAMFREGGSDASVRHISPSDNRGAGSSIGSALSDLPDGTLVKIVVVP